MWDQAQAEQVREQAEQVRGQAEQVRGQAEQVRGQARGLCVCAVCAQCVHGACRVWDQGTRSSRCLRRNSISPPRTGCR